MKQLVYDNEREVIACGSVRGDKLSGGMIKLKLQSVGDLEEVF